MGLGPRLVLVLTQSQRQQTASVMCVAAFYWKYYTHQMRSVDEANDNLSSHKKEIANENDLKPFGCSLGTRLGGVGGEGGRPFAVTYKTSLRHLVTD